MRNIGMAALVLSALIISGNAVAATAVDNVNVTQIGAYANDTVHFVWATNRSPECAADPVGIYAFNEASPGGKGILALLTTAQINNRKVLIRADACTITEIYLK